MAERSSEIKEGDTVIVDEGYRNGGYLAEVITVYGKYFARIRHEEDEWDIMKNRLKLKNE